MLGQPVTTAGLVQRLGGDPVALTDRVLEIMQLAKFRLNDLTDAQVRDLTAAWVSAWDDLQPEVEAVVTDMVTTAGPKGVVNLGSVQRNRRLLQTLERAEEVLEQLGSEAAERIAQDLPEAVQLAARAHVEHLAVQLPPEDQMAERLGLGMLNQDTLDAVVTRTTQQITAAALPISAASAAAMRAELVRGVVVGSNPNEVARRIMQRTGGAFEGGLARATNVARTEMLDAYRRTNQLSAINNRQVITARVWVATLDTRTCGSCLAKHGSEWPVESFGPLDHQQGRCTFIDRTIKWADIDPALADLDGPDTLPDRDAWWDNLTASAQDATLGKAKADLLRSGQITWDDLSTKRSTPEWRDSFTETPLRDLT